MKNLIFKYAAAWNFLPFGPEGIEIHFDKYKNIILVQGENQDAKAIEDQSSEEAKISSNGSGKSSLQEMIVYGLFGKTVKRPEKVGVNDVVHNKVGQDCKIELIFDKYKLIRIRKENGKDKHSLRLWESDKGIWDKNTEITQGTMASTQKKIEDIIGLSYDAFVSMCIFTDDQRACFLECDTIKKKEIVENLLSLAIYRDWFDNAKVLKKEIKSKVDLKSKEYQLLLGNQSDAERRLLLTQKKDLEWKTSKKNELDFILNKIELTKKSLESTDTGMAVVAYQNAQEKIKEINEKIPLEELAKEELTKNMKTAQNKENDLKKEALGIQQNYDELARDSKFDLNDRKKIEDKISNLESNINGTICDNCCSVVQENNIKLYTDKLRLEINEINTKIKENLENLKEIGVKTEELKIKQNKISTFIKQIEKKIQEIDNGLKVLRNGLTLASQVREPMASNSEAILQQQIESLREQHAIKKSELEGVSPFKDILENDVLELDKTKTSVIDKEIEVKDLESELPYYDYWITGFGDHGIRKWVVEGIIPELNARINYWLQFLIDNRITLKFDNELNEKIERNPIDGDPYIYHTMSTGQRRRLNLAVSQSFAHIMTMSSGSIPSVIFLDEVSTNVDPLGVQGIFNMISELSEDKQVFVTTHDPDLLRMLEGADVIKLSHKNGYTKLV